MRRTTAGRPTVIALVSFLAGLVLAIPSHRLAAAPAPVTRLYSGVASAGGANNTAWRSEVVLANPGAAAVDLLLEIVPRDQQNVVSSTPLTLVAGETRHLPDLYAAMGAPSGAGTLRLTGDALAWVRTFNQAAQGTFGTDVPGVVTDGGFKAGLPVLFPINTPADSGKEFRSNLLVTNLESTKATFTVSAGTSVKTFDLEAGTFTQINGIGGWLGAAQGASVLSVVSTGRWSGLVTTIDPALGDPTSARGLATGTRDTRLFAGVASATGMNNTVWRSEAVLYNAGLSRQSVKLEIVPRGESAVAASTTLSLGPFELKSLPDVYAAVGAGSGAGVLRVTGDVLTWVRTFNQGAGATFGTDVPEVAPGVGYGVGASVAFPISSTADITTGFRSNFLVLNHESREITLTFSAGTVSGTLKVPASAFIQQSDLGAYLGLPPGQQMVKVSGTGRWSAIVTAIDPFLGDPTTVLGFLTGPNPVPTGVGAAIGGGSSAVIGSAGGSVASPDGRLTLSVPSGALAASKTITVQPVTNLAWGGLGNAYSLGPEGTAFAKPATISFALAAGDTSSVSLEGLGIGFQDVDGYWQWVPGATRDSGANRISVSTSHLSPWSLLTGVVLLPSEASVDVGQKLDLAISECYPLPLAPLAPDDPLAPLVPGVPCEKIAFQKVPTTSWFVNQVGGGNSTFGTVDGFMNIGHFTAPAKAPNPSTVAVSAEFARYANLRNVTVVSHVTIGGDLKGTFTLAVSTPLKMSYTVRGDATLKAFLSNADGIAYDMTGTVTISSPISFSGLTCTCAESATKPIPADAVFSIQRRPALTQHWVMPGVSWNFTCLPGGITLPVAAQYFLSAPGDCSQAVWLPISDEKHPAGSYTSTCNPAYTVQGSWDFQ